MYKPLCLQYSDLFTKSFLQTCEPVLYYSYVKGELVQRPARKKTRVESYTDFAQELVLKLILRVGT